MSEQKCAFCGDYDDWQKIHKFKAEHPEYYGDASRLKHDITVAMVIRTYYPGHKRQASRTTDYRSQGCGYKLNYCPECGKKLNSKRCF